LIVTQRGFKFSELAPIRVKDKPEVLAFLGPLYGPSEDIFEAWMLAGGAFDDQQCGTEVWIGRGKEVLKRTHIDAGQVVAENLDAVFAEFLYRGEIICDGVSSLLAEANNPYEGGTANEGGR
jgi:hypothetical protein